MPSKAFRAGSVRTRGNRIAADCCWSWVRVQICSRLKDRGCPTRPSGTGSPGLAGTELQWIAAGAGCVCKSVPGLRIEDALQGLQGRIRLDSREQNCSERLPGLNVGANLWKNHYKNHYNIQKGLSLSDFSCNFAESVIALTTSGLGERFHTMALMFFR